MAKFKDKRTEQIAAGYLIKGLDSNIIKKARLKIRIITSAIDVNDLRIPPGNHLEKLQGERKEQYSIRVNERYRLCFYWVDGQPEEIEFIDYH